MMLCRRAVLAGGLALPGLAWGETTRAPVKIGHRAASMKMVGDFDVMRTASQIPGLDGVELQIAAGKPNLWDLDAVRRYKAEAHRWGMAIPSLAGVWGKGVSIRRSPVAGIHLQRAIRAAELLGSSVILVAFFRDNCPSMDDEAEYGPVVELLRTAAPMARDVGVVLGLENSLSPADNARLVDLVGEPNVSVYYDVHNMAYYGHGAEAVPGIELLGRERICQVHVKNEDRLIADEGAVDWEAALDACSRIGFDGWYVLESRHTDRAQMMASTAENVRYIRGRLGA